MVSSKQFVPSRYIVAGTHSGVGKTTITLTVLKALSSQGLRVRPFKIGPDFIDTAYHTEVAGRQAINLDLWMMGTNGVKSSFSHYGHHSDVAIIEAMGALYDGDDGTASGSAAELSKLLDAPIILVVDIWGMTRSLQALLNGFFSFDPEVKFAGFVMNRAGSERHVEMVLKSLPDRLRALCLGYVLHREDLSIPERHLGLVTVAENSKEAAERSAALSVASKTLELGRLLRSISSRPKGDSETHRTLKDRIRIAVARDPAFCFYYAENLDALEEAGAELYPFSPTKDSNLPTDIAGVYIGGGYPESFATALASNTTIKEELRRLADLRMPIYAECGGFMYLGRTLTGFTGRAQSMANVFPMDTIMDREHLTIRYVAVSTLVDSPFGPAGTKARGQEFHQSRIEGPVLGSALYRVVPSTGEECTEGSVFKNVTGSYIHLHFASNPNIPRNFVDNCGRWLQEHRNARV